MRLEVEPQAPWTRDALAAEHKARQARMAEVKPPPPAPDPVGPDGWPIGAQSIFAIALIRWFVVHLQWRAILAEKRALGLRVGKPLHERVQIVLRDAAAKHMVGVSEIIGPSRQHRICAARFEVYFRLHLLGLSTPQIGRRLGDRDHTSVLYGMRRHVERMRALGARREV